MEWFAIPAALISLGVLYFLLGLGNTLQARSICKTEIAKENRKAEEAKAKQAADQLELERLKQQNHTRPS